MKGTSMSDWCTVQLFISDDGVCEVLGHVDDYRKLKCTCNSYSPVGKCKHVKFMRKYMDENEGTLQLTIPERATDDEIDDAMTDHDEFRRFLIKYGKVEYLP